MIITNIMAFTALVIAVFTYIKVEREARESNSGYNEDYQRIHDRLSRNYVEQAEAIANLQYDLSKYKKDSPRLSETYKSVKKRKTNKVNSSKVSNKKPNNKKQIAK